MASNATLPVETAVIWSDGEDAPEGWAHVIDGNREGLVPADFLEIIEAESAQPAGPSFTEA